MIVRIPGFFDLGISPAPGVRSNCRTTIRVPYGADWTLEVDPVDSTGAPLRIVSGDTIVLSIRRKSTDAAAAISKTGTNGMTSVSFAIASGDVKRAVQPGNYIFDVWITRSAKRSPLVPLSTVIFEAVATPPP